MSGSTQRCPKCNGELIQGFVVDYTEGGGRFVQHWAVGPPQKSFLMGTKLPKGCLPVGTFRCKSCGYLESYASDEFASQ
jgi:hypothetical protein